MAFQALIKSQPVAQGPDQIAFFVQYYDDANPANSPTPTVFLESVTLLFASASATKAIVQAAIIARGQDLRATGQKIAAIQQTLTIPATIQIP